VFVPPTHHITIYQGDNFDQTFQVLDGEGEPLDLSAVTAGAAQMRLAMDRTADLIVSFVVDITQRADGVFTFSLDADASSSIGVKKGFYDVQLREGDNRVRTYLRGEVEILPEITVNDA
jgi:hypothetical protein